MQGPGYRAQRPVPPGLNITGFSVKQKQKRPGVLDTPGRFSGFTDQSKDQAAGGTTAVTSISTRARSSIRAATSMAVMAGKLRPIVAR